MGDRYPGSGLVFAIEVGSPWTGTTLHSVRSGRFLARAGLPQIMFHDLGHTCATILLSKGVHTRFVQELLGTLDDIHSPRHLPTLTSYPAWATRQQERWISTQLKAGYSKRAPAT